jgi:beta-glucanase (GH16 family)/putative cell wall-binding protein
MKFKRIMALCTFFTVMSGSISTFAAGNVSSLGERLGGSNRYETSAIISKYGWNEGSDYVILASGMSFADALCAVPLAKKYNAPLILTESSSLSQSAKTELNRLKPKQVIIVGGVGAVSEKVESAISNELSVTPQIKRIGGKDRFETSTKIAEEIGNSEAAFITNGYSYADALSISSIAGIKGSPILLTGKDYLPETITKFISDKKVSNAYIIGGKGAVGEEVEASANRILGHASIRVAGSDRYETNVEVLKEFDKDFKYNNVLLAVGYGPKGNEFADALSGSALAAKLGAPLLLTYKNLPRVTEDFIISKVLKTTVTIGLGEKAVLPDKALETVAKYVAVTSNTGDNGTTPGGNNGTTPGGNNGTTPGGDNGGGTEPSTPTWTMVWNDEFSGNSVDPAKWKFDEGNWGVSDDGHPYQGWGNNEKQNYIAGDNNVTVKDGELIITAKKEQSNDKYGGPYDYTSAKLKTKGLFSKQYGKFELRAKLPAGKGLWPAFWMMPEKELYGAWAASGEIDILEAWGSKTDTVRGTLHYGEMIPNNKNTGKNSDQDPAFKAANPNFNTTDYHVYALEWEPGEIRWYIDGHLYQTQNSWYSKGVNQPVKYAFPAPFDKPYYMMLNLAVGGDWDGEPTAETLFPSSMAVDYVRVYEKTGAPYKTAVDYTMVKEEYPSNAKLPLVDGNFVYNNNLDQDVAGVDNINGVPNTAYWTFLNLPAYKGEGSVAIEPINNKNFAHISIGNQGNQTYSLQLIQRVTVGAVRAYKLTFDAKSAGARDIKVKIGGDESRGWALYSKEYTVPLTEELKSYEYSFNMDSQTDLNARMEFNVGLDDKDVWIGNVKLVEIERISTENDAKKPLATGEHIYNGSFDLGDTSRMNYWNFNVNNGQAVASVNSDTRELKVDVADGAQNTSEISLDQQGLELREKCTYKVSFKARVDAGDMPIQLQLTNDDGSITYSEIQEFALTTDMNEYSFEFKPSTTDRNSKLTIYLGGERKIVYLDNISMLRTQDYLVGGQLVENGTFDSTIDPWIINGASGNLEDGKTKINVTNIGSNPWDVQLLLKPLTLTKGHVYKVSFDVSSSVNRDIEAVLQKSSGDYAVYSSTTVSTTSTKTHQEYEFTMDSDTDVQAQFVFNLGKVNSGAQGEHVVYFDNISLIDKTAANTGNELLSNTTFETGIEPWIPTVGNWDGGPGADADISIEDEQVKFSVRNVGSEEWAVQLKSGFLTLTQGKTYKLSFDVKSSVQRDIKVIVQNGEEYNPTYFAQELTTVVQGKHYEYEFTMEDVTDSKVVLAFSAGKVGNSNTVGEHVIYLDNFSLIEQGSEPSENDEGSTPPANNEDSSNLISNGSFTSNTNGWQNEWNDGSAGSIKAEGGQMVVTTTTVGPNVWSSKVYFSGLTLENGKTYTLKFKASADAARTIAANVGKQLNVTPYFINYFDGTTLSLTTTMQDFSYDFTVTKDTDANIRVVFDLGPQSGVTLTSNIVYFDDVVLVERIN